MPENTSLTEEIQVMCQWVNAVSNKELTKSPTNMLKETVDVTWRNLIHRLSQMTQNFPPTISSMNCDNCNKWCHLWNSFLPWKMNYYIKAVMHNTPSTNFLSCYFPKEYAKKHRAIWHNRNSLWGSPWVPLPLSYSPLVMRLSPGVFERPKTQERKAVLWFSGKANILVMIWLILLSKS